MRCDRCHINEATTHYSESINGIRKERHLCSECAAKEGLDNFGLPSFANVFSNLFNLTLSPYEEKVCPNCKTTLSSLSKSGKVGCEECYDTFEKELRPLILKVHSTQSHKGSRPVSTPFAPQTVDSLKAELKEAIEKEDFERAAVLRDKIKEEEAKNE